MNNFEPLQKYSKVAAPTKKAVMTAATPIDLMRYDLRIQAALRGVVRTVLQDVARNGLPGDHHFFIAFRTTAPDVQMSDRLRREYPDEMNIVLQHQFWDLTVGEREFEVGLSFRNIPEKLLVPFDAVTSFIDPHVQFALKFEVEGANDAASPMNASPAEAPKLREVPPVGRSQDKLQEKLQDKFQNKPQEKPDGQTVGLSNNDAAEISAANPAKLFSKRETKPADGKAGQSKSGSGKPGENKSGNNHAENKEDTAAASDQTQGKTQGQTQGKVIALDAFRKKQD